MAGGKLSARQKMINLMYLVFIAMMALNMSKEVLAAFGLMNKKLEQSNERTTERNVAFLSDLEKKVEEQPEKYKPELEKTKAVGKLSDDLIAYLEKTKEVILSDVPTDKREDYQTMDKSNTLDEYFFKGGQVTPAGEEFISKVNAYREGINKELTAPGSTTDFSEIIKSVNADFSTEDVISRDGVKKNWLRYNYEGFPMVASLTKLTQMESDVKKDQSEILSAILGGKLKSEVSLTNFEAIVVADKTAFFSGERFKGKIVLGKKDKTLRAHKVVVNGKELSSDLMQDGQTILDFPAGNPGDRKIKGEFQFKEGDSIVTIPIESSYSVIPAPNAAVISADKMNVVYRGVQNPMTISVPGASNVVASAPGLKKSSGSKYVMNVTSLKQREVKINVKASVNGKSFPSSRTFRIKDIPRPVGTVRGEDGSVKMTKNALAISTVGAILPDFDFNLKLRVTGFKIKVPGQPTVRVSGSKLNSQARAALKRAKRGESVQIFDINAKLASGSSYRVKKVSPVIIELTN